MRSVVVLPEPDAPTSATSSRRDGQRDGIHRGIGVPRVAARHSLEHQRARSPLGSLARWGRAGAHLPRWLLRMLLSQYFIHVSRLSASSFASTGITLSSVRARRTASGSESFGRSVRAGMRRNFTAASLNAAGVVTYS